MRITEHQRKVILRVIKASIPDARVMLFGSRVDDSKKGGDIDLYVEVQNSVSALKVARARRIIEDDLEIKVDLVVNDERGSHLPIFDIARKTGVAL